MAAATTILAVAAGLMAADRTVKDTTTEKENQVRGEQRRVEGEMNALNQKMKTEKDQNEAVAKESSGQARARSRQRALALEAQGRSGTILTSPLGVPGGGSSGANKTLLGS